MISRNYKVLEVREGHEYIFDSFALKASVREYVSDKKASGEICSIEKVKCELAKAAYATVDSITNWIYGRNGVADLKTVKDIADFLGVEYTSLLRIKENTTMIDPKILDSGVVKVDMNETKDVIRTIYQKMAMFMDRTEEFECYDLTEEEFKVYERYYIDLKTTLHLSMLDIPIEIYKKFQSVLDQFEFYLYGINGGSVDIWECSDYKDFLKEKNLDDCLNSMIDYMEHESQKFYEEMREILKAYIVS